MIGVDQRYPADPTRDDGLSAEGRVGDCLRCCVSTTTGVPYSDVPHFAENGDDWWDSLRRWCIAELGYDMAVMAPAPDGTFARFLDDPEDTIAIGVGTSPRRATGRHAIVVDGLLNLLHDPHPSRYGLDRVEELYVLVPIGTHPPPEPAPS